MKWHLEIIDCLDKVLTDIMFYLGETSYFVCEKWFAVEEEDGKIEREIMRTEHGLGFTAVSLITSKQSRFASSFMLVVSGLYATLTY